jgi:hypothetical protein
MDPKLPSMLAKIEDRVPQQTAGLTAAILKGAGAGCLFRQSKLAVEPQISTCRGVKF